MQLRPMVMVIRVPLFGHFGMKEIYIWVRAVADSGNCHYDNDNCRESAPFSYSFFSSWVVRFRSPLPAICRPQPINNEASLSVCVWGGKI